jgi:hypothetical protein
MKSIYVLLTRTNTVPARLIHAITGDDYTHASISLDKDLNDLYSFARRSMRMPLIAGLIHENIYTGIFAQNLDAPCVLYEIRVHDTVYDSIKSAIERMMQDYDLYRYNFLGLAMNFFGIPYGRKYHFLCSQFVAHILDKYGALRFNKNINLIKPADFCNLPDLNEIYRGRLRYVKLYSLQNDIMEYDMAKAAL